MNIGPMRTAFPCAVLLLALLFAGLKATPAPAAVAQNEPTASAAEAAEEGGVAAEEPAKVAVEGEQEADSAGVPFYIHPLWFLLFAVAVGFWIYIASWVNMDGRGLRGVDESLWTAIVMAAGVFGLAFTLLLHVAFAFLMVAVVIGACALYVGRRNQFVPERHRLFGPHHRAELFSRIPLLSRLSDYKPAVTAEADVVLTSDAGESLEAVVAGQPAFARAAEALMDIVARAAATESRTARVIPHDGQYTALLVMDGVPQSLATYEEEAGHQLIACASLFLGLSSEGRVRQGSARFYAELPGSGTVDVEARIQSVRQKPALVLNFPDWTPDRFKRGLEALGMHEALVKRLRAAVEQERGSIVVAGQPGSGRTTTLYAIVGLIDIFTTDVITLEAEQEYELEQVRHWPLPKDRPFQEVLDEVLREGPDTIVFGNLESGEEASPLLRFGAQEGKLLATLESASAPEALILLRDMTDSPGLVGQSVVCTVAQKLVRRLCPECKEQFEPDPNFLQRLDLDPSEPGTWFRPVGCHQCLETGYRGRIGLYSMLIVTDRVREALQEPEASAASILEQAGKAAFRSLQQDGLSKVAAGVTTLEEVRRVLKDKTGNRTESARREQ